MATILETATASNDEHIRSSVSAEEWAVRVDLAAAYRLVALYGWDDLIFTHLSARVPGPEHHFLINPYDMMFDEVSGALASGSAAIPRGYVGGCGRASLPF
jgi:hypothetical protein